MDEDVTVMAVTGDDEVVELATKSSDDVVAVSDISNSVEPAMGGTEPPTPSNSDAKISLSMCSSASGSPIRPLSPGLNGDFLDNSRQNR